MTSNDTKAATRLPILSEAERQKLVYEWNATAREFPREACIHQLIEDQVVKRPEAAAVVFEDGELSYAELNRQANRLAHHLRGLGVKPGARVGICLERGFEMMVALLAVLKAGGAYVPLDPAYPPGSLLFMLQDSEPLALVTQSHLQKIFSGLDSAVPLLDLGDASAAWNSQSDTNPLPQAIGLTSSHLAYLIYTSGSTGRPKGVGVAHSSVVNLLQEFQNNAYISPGTACSAWTSSSFDVSVYEIFSALVAGGVLHIPPDAVRLDPNTFLEWIRREGIQSAYIPPFMVPAFAQSINPGNKLGRLLVGVEPIPHELLQNIASAFPGLRVINGYGPTETTVCSTLFYVSAANNESRNGPAPIGKPIVNTQVYVVDEEGGLSPVGVPGELYIAGEGLAGGYFGRPKETAERFGPNPFSKKGGERLYRTGDVVRWREDGNLEYVGRTDQQVKVRGFRVELGEIEAVLNEHAEIEQAVVTTREAAGEKQLVAYVVGSGEKKLSAGALRDYVSSRMPTYMVPGVFVEMESLPLTPNGKLDRQALPAPEITASDFECRTELEGAIARACADVLGTPSIPMHSTFIELGGSSLNATRAIAAIREATSLSLPLSELLGTMTLREVALGIEQHRTLLPVDGGELKRRREGDKVIPAASSQERVWFVQSTNPSSRAYHSTVKIRFLGELNKSALEKALSEIVKRHEIYRTTFSEIEGNLFQIIHGPWTVELDPVDVQAAPDKLASVMDDLQAPFDLAALPLVRWKLVQVDGDEHILLMVEHHLVHDGWSFNVFLKELTEIYRSFTECLEPRIASSPFQFGDFSQWQREWMMSPEASSQLGFWSGALKDVPSLLALPYSRPRPLLQAYRGAQLRLPLNKALEDQLRSVARREHVTLYVVFAAALEILFYRYSHQEDFCIGAGIANRRWSETKDLIGMLVNNIPLRARIDGNLRVAELVHQVKQTTLEAYLHQDVPFDKIVQAINPVRNPSYHPVFQAMLSFHDSPLECAQLADARLIIEPALSNGSAKFDLSIIAVAPQNHNLPRNFASYTEIVWEYNSDLFDEALAQQMLRHYISILTAITHDRSQRVSEVPILSDVERCQVLHEWNASTAEYPSEECIQQLFAEQVERTPNATAVVCEEESLSYRELNRRANQLGHYLRKMGVGPDSRVAICVERGLEMIVGLLGVLKAGGAYVPLDPSYPPERLRFMLEDSAPVVLLTQGHLEGLFTGVRECLAVLDVTAAATWQEQPDTDLECASVGLTSEHLAYVIYTSGSTGQPKGVMVEHQGVVRLVRNTNYVQLGTEDVVAQASNVSFDAATFEIWGALLAGARLVIISKNALLSRAVFGQELRQNRINTLFLTTALFNEVAREAVEAFAGLRYLLFGGEEVETRWVARVLGEAKVQHLLHVYGPTETVTFATWHEVRTVEEGRTVPIGRPIANTRVYILDANLEPAPVGVAGELYIGGPGVARGYWQRVELTAERFVKDPFVEEAGTGRMYRTGDLGRWLPDGTIEFIGRNDQQVKLRGFRIELGEIEARLAEHPGVGAAVVVAREDVPGEKRLVAYYTRVTSRAQEETEEKAGPEQLRAHLAARLPEYMVPAAYVQLESLPLTRNGKIDRKELPAPEGDAYATRGYLAPEGELENLLAGIWQELLRVEGVGRHDNFFELGGHSLLAMRVITRIRQVLSVEVTISDLFAHPVLADLARVLQSARQTELPSITPVPRGERLPLSFAQQQLWFLAQMEGVSEAYHIPLALRLSGKLDAEVLRRALNRLLGRHEALRTIFTMVDGQPVQRILPAADVCFQLLEHDLRRHEDAEAESERLAAQEAINPFNLETGPLIRGRLIRQARDEHTLLITMHHIVSDGWSMGVMQDELSALYGAFYRGQADPLPELELQYVDYAVWQRQWTEGEILREQGEYWKTTLAGSAAVLELPTDHVRPPERNYAGARVEIELGEEITARVRELGRRHGTTLYMMLLAGWALLLARLSGQPDVVIGTPVANRRRAEIEKLIGFFVNMLAMRVDVSNSPTVGELLERVKRQVLTAQQHQDIPFEKVVELIRPVRTLAYSPVFQAVFAWQNAPQSSLELLDVKSQALPTPGPVMAKFDLRLFLQEADGRIVGRVEYATALYERATIERYAGYFQSLIAGMVNGDEQVADRLEMLSKRERHELVYEWNRTAADYREDKCIHELFEEQAGKTPNAIAVVHEQACLTYGELNRRANQLGHYLRKLGVTAETVVGICLESSLATMVGVLGILKAGGAYLPLDPGSPQSRLHYMLRDARAVAIVTEQIFAEQFPQALLHLYLDRDCNQLEKESCEPLEGVAGPANLAYVIYTSGSTGNPKGVMVPHHNMTTYVRWANGFMFDATVEIVPAVQALTFDGSLKQLFAPLLSGLTIWVFGRKELAEPIAFLKTLVTRRNLRFSSVPSLWAAMLEVMESGEFEFPPDFIAAAFIGGDEMPKTVAERSFKLLPGLSLWNFYGPTETTVTAATAQIHPQDRITVGRPIAGKKIYILDQELCPVPRGVVGEIYIGGEGIVRGYLNRADLTAESFIPDPFSEIKGTRLYRTRDRGRYLEDGRIELLGRSDHQVKIRGFRVELGEIEATLRQNARVGEAVVVVHEDEPGNKRLVAYYTAHAKEEQSNEEEAAAMGAGELRAYLAERLPEYMIPTAYVRLERLPLLQNGKLDRKGLPAFSEEAYGSTEYEPPVGQTETAIANIWAELLHVERIGRHDNFFQLGGHSLLAVRAVSRLRQRLDVSIAISDFFFHSSLSQLAEHILSMQLEELDATEVMKLAHTVRGSR